jgi:hypothetical protein
MKRPSVLSIALVLFALLVVLYLVVNTEWGEVEVPTPLLGEAAANPFYAAQRLVETLGATSERRESLGDTGNAAIVVLSTWGWDINDARRAELERWVELGGRLVVDAALITGSDAFEVWSGIRHESEEPDADPDLFEPTAVIDPCRSLQVTGTEIDAEAPPERYEACNFDSTSWFETSGEPLWGLSDDGFLMAVRVAVGRGTVTAVNGVPFVYRELFEGEHGELFAAAAGVRAGDHVVFMTEADVASLPALVWRHGAPVVAVLLLSIALALWRGSMRFGPLVAPSERARRSLAEQILGTGRFAVRVGGGAALIGAVRRALHEAASRRIVGYERLDDAARAEAVAALAGVDAGELKAALEPMQNPRPLDLRATLALLESTRRQLVSRSQWSKHGKRI